MATRKRDADPFTGATPAAMYVRMSAEHQRYSIANQTDAILRYAIANGFEVVRTYTDRGRSGLTLRGRDALKALLADVEGGRADYRAVLVFDVSRWGRFQDPDESAAHEITCKRAGIKVHYCAEDFANDNSLGSVIQKMIRRGMAGEYSRQLSAKVFEGQRRLAAMGYWQGGPPGYGLRRLVVDGRGRPVRVLEAGERKAVIAERVVLVPGPPEEVAVVREIFDLFVSGLDRKAIARRLNERGVRADNGRPWVDGGVGYVLEGEKYAGVIAWNKTSFRLQVAYLRNEPEDWVLVEGACEPIVERAVFERARARIRAEREGTSDAELLADLRRLLKRRGRLTSELIASAPGMRRVCCYADRFGSLRRAYALAGYEPPKDYGYYDALPRVLEKRPAVAASVADAIRASGGEVVAEDGGGLRLADGRRVAVEIAHPRRRYGRHERWVFRPAAAHDRELTVVARMVDLEEEPEDYVVLTEAERAGKWLYEIRCNRKVNASRRAPDLRSLVERLRPPSETAPA